MRKTMRKIEIKTIVALMATSVSIVFTQADFLLDDMKTMYAFDQWVGITKTNYTRAVSSFSPDFTNSGYVTNVLAEAEILDDGIDFYVQLKKQSCLDEEIDIRVMTYSDISLTHNALMDYFRSSSALHPFPNGDTFSPTLGDRCYVGYPTNTTTSIIFVRNNVLVRVRTDNATNSVLPIATWLDKYILDSSF
jgi:hypothetical protein